MVLTPNIRWCSTTRTRRSASGAQPQYRWCSEDQILRVVVNENSNAFSAALSRVSIRFVAKGLRQRLDPSDLYRLAPGFYSLCREGSSSTRLPLDFAVSGTVSIRFVAKGLRQRGGSDYLA